MIFRAKCGRTLLDLSIADNSSHTETIWIEVVNENSSNIVICTVYRPEEDKMLKWNTNFESEMGDAYIEHKYIIVKGILMLTC